jgi:hypothetical protein
VLPQNFCQHGHQVSLLNLGTILHEERLRAS